MTLFDDQMFYSVVDTEWSVSCSLHLVGIVCYYAHHYSTFFFHSKMKIWILFDDSHVRKVRQTFHSGCQHYLFHLKLYSSIFIMFFVIFGGGARPTFGAVAPSPQHTSAPTYCTVLIMVIVVTEMPS